MGKLFKLHKSDLAHWPRASVSSYKDEDIEVVQSVRTFKYFARFKVADRTFVFWTESFDVSVLENIRKLRRAYCQELEDLVSDLSLPFKVTF